MNKLNINFPKFSKLTKKNIKGFLIIIFVILVLYFIISNIIVGNRNKTCQELRKEIIKQTDIYISDNNLLPNLNGTSQTIYLSDLYDSIVFKDYAVTGTVTYTKYNDTYIKSIDIANASYCNTKDFTNESSQFDENKNAKVEVTFNYVEVDSYNSKWTSWYPSENISKEETNGVLLPIDERNLPDIPDNASITEYVRETKTYYSYRDKKWRWYKNNVKYSDFSSEKPKGYTTKDTSISLTTEATAWSLDYPEEKDYRSIKQATGYRWYYLDGEEKIYWNNGEYSPTSPGEEYKKDNDFKATMYSYTDKTWRWYNGETKRIYSSYSSTKPNTYNYKDEATLTYTNWSSFKDKSSLNNSNKSYREEKTDIYSRYLIKYDIYSYPILDNYVSLEELEKNLGKKYEEINNDENIKIKINFKFIYE